MELDSDPEVMRYIGSRPSNSVDWYRERIHSVYVPWQKHSWHGIRIVETLKSNQDGNEFLGWVFIRPAHLHANANELGWQSDAVEIGFRYRQLAWGKGIATEAAIPLVEQALADSATPAIVGCALASNLGSLRVLEKLGLERSGQVHIPDFSEAIITFARSKG
jgi:RimJ/RimL family protein N-acetyltransferase